MFCDLIRNSVHFSVEAKLISKIISIFGMNHEFSKNLRSRVNGHDNVSTMFITVSFRKNIDKRAFICIILTQLAFSS